MNMHGLFKGGLLALVLGSAGALSGCNGSGFQYYARAIEKTLGTPVEIRASDDDLCALDLLLDLGDEYRRMSKEDRQALEDAARGRYTKVVLEASRPVQSIRGELVEVELWEPWAECQDENRSYQTDQNCNVISRQQVEARALSDTRTVSGPAPGTFIEVTNGVLTIAAERRESSAVRQRYWTYDPALFDRIRGPGDVYPDTDFMHGFWRLRYDRDTFFGERCGKSASLRDLVAR